jgi:hypothetical protein
VKKVKIWGRLLAWGRPPPAVQAVRSTAPTRGRDCVPKFGPVVAIVSVTVVVPAPAAIDAGLNPQLVNAGKLAQPKLTAELNDPAPTGVAEKV